MSDKRDITDFTGKTVNIDCLGCARQRGEIEDPIGSVYISENFDAHQDFEIPVPGFIIVATKRHIKSIDEFTEEEKTDFIDSMVKVRKALREALNIEFVYLIQEEDTSHHFHFWIFPRYDWMEKQFGRKIQSVRPIMEYAREKLKTEDNLEKVKDASQKLKEYLIEQ